MKTAVHYDKENSQLLEEEPAFQNHYSFLGDARQTFLTKLGSHLGR